MGKITLKVEKHQNTHCLSLYSSSEEITSKKLIVFTQPKEFWTPNHYEESAYTADASPLQQHIVEKLFALEHPPAGGKLVSKVYFKINGLNVTTFFMPIKNVMDAIIKALPDNIVVAKQ